MITGQANEYACFAYCQSFLYMLFSGRRSVLLRWPSPSDPHLTITSVVPEQAYRKTQQQQTETKQAGQPQQQVHQAADGQETSDNSIAAGVGSAIKHAGGNGGGEEEEEGEGAGVTTASSWQPWACPSPNAWQEVPPGLYSLTLILPESLVGSITQSTVDKLTLDSLDQVQGLSKVLETNKQDVQGVQRSGWCHELHAAGERWVLAHHPWEDAGAQCLCAYQRPLDMIQAEGEEAVPPPGSVPRNNAAALHKAQERRAKPSSPAPLAVTHQLGAGIQGDLGPSDQLTGIVDAAAQYGLPADVVDMVLAVLREAVRVRCHNIEPHDNVTTLDTQDDVTTLDTGPSPAERTQPANKDVSSIAATSTPIPVPTPDAPLLTPLSSPVTLPGILPPAPVLVLFSGGIDSVLLAALVHQCLPSGAPIDLSNVCFDAGRSPDRVAAVSAYEELRAYAPDRTWRLILTDATLKDVDENKCVNHGVEMWFEQGCRKIKIGRKRGYNPAWVGLWVVLHALIRKQGVLERDGETSPHPSTYHAHASVRRQYR